jgi:hypothetical protein
MEDEDRLVGTLLDDRYEIKSSLDRGGMGTIYLAWDSKLERKVVVFDGSKEASEGWGDAATLERLTAGIFSVSSSRGSEFSRSWVFEEGRSSDVIPSLPSLVWCSSKSHPILNWRLLARSPESHGQHNIHT